jgi:putative FmdB family regulatory protein
MRAASTVKESTAMPYYVFFCQDCKKEFTQVLHIADLEKGSIACPHCGGTNVAQQVAAFSAVTSRKS